MMARQTAFMLHFLRQDTRRISVHFLRLSILALTLFFLYRNASGSRINTNAAGVDLLKLLSNINVFMIFVMGIFFFPTTLTEEKENGSLGLVMMTGISPFSFMMGKFVPRLITGFILLLIQIPFASLAITLGGVTLQQVICLYIIYAFLLFWMGSLALLYSASSKNTFHAMIGTFWLYVLCMVIAIPAITAGISYSWTVFGAIHNLLSTIQVSPQRILLEYGISHLVIGLFFIQCAYREFKKYLENQPLEATEESLEQEEVQLESEVERKSVRVWNNAYFWQGYHTVGCGHRFMLEKSLFYLFLLLMFIIIVIGQSSDYESMMNDLHGNANFLKKMFYWIFVFLLYVCASRFFYYEDSGKMYDTLHLTPGSWRKKNWMKIAGALLAILPSFGFMLIFGIIEYFTNTGSPKNMKQSIYVRNETFLYCTDLIFIWSIPIFCAHLAAWFSKRNILSVIFALVMTANCYFLPDMIYEVPYLRTNMEICYLISTCLFILLTLILHFVMFPYLLKKSL